MESYPSSIYAADAEKRMIALKNRLANHELAAADFYARREAWIAVIHRAQEILRDFPDTEAARKSLPLMLEAYRALDLKEPAKQTEALIQLNS